MGDKLLPSKGDSVFGHADLRGWLLGATLASSGCRWLGAVRFVTW